MQHEYKVGVALSNSVVRSYLQRTLVDITQWRHFRLTVKLGNIYTTMRDRRVVTIKH